MARDRAIRVFVSSTFRDMKAERDWLVKHVFPRLRRLCAERYVAWSEVDLRWGITEEQAADGKVLPICLAEIERCRPYFIGILGERYGWVPEEIPTELLEMETWLAEHREHSVTALEIIHGVLRNPEMERHAFFYFRDPAFSEQIEEGLRKEPGYEAEPAGSKDKLVQLKKEISIKNFPILDGYKDLKAFGERVYKDLEEVIDRLYPADEIPDPLDREAADHEAYADSRRKVYVGGEKYFKDLNALAEAAGEPLIVLGESGSGKSALLSNWAARYEEAHPAVFLIKHFIGATPYSADWAAMLRRVMGELKRRFDIKDDIPDRPEELRAAFANWLHMASAKGRVILVLDALNQLEDRDNAPELVWLPPFIPENIRLILSTLPGRPLDALKKRGWPTLVVKPLDENERRELITKELTLTGRSLSPEHAGLIATAPQAENPLYLKAFISELLVFGVHEMLRERMEHYLEAKTLDDLFEKILIRWEEDYEGDTDLVGDAMSLIWASRRGLSEAELLDILGDENGPLPHAVWSPLYLAAEESLVTRSGLLNFAHDYMRKAVHDAYVPNDKGQRAVHVRVADYFEKRGLDERKTDELPWQLSEAREWQRLYDLLADLSFFYAAYKADQFEVMGYWSQIEGSSGLRIVDAYRTVLDSPDAFDSEHIWQVAILLADTGYLGEALTLREHLVDYYRKAGDKTNLQASLGNQALILSDWGRLDEALALHKEEEYICRELDNLDGLSYSLGNQANILYTKGRLDESMGLYKEQERICRKLGKNDGLSKSIAGQAFILRDRGRLDEAIELQKASEHICRVLGNKVELACALGNQANILMDWGKLDEAMALHKEEERICRELGNRDYLQISLGNQALILRDWGRVEEAMELLKEQERICRDLGNKDGLSKSLGNQALILQGWGRLDEAMTLHKEEERICRELGDKKSLQISVGNQAAILYTKGRLNEAMRLYKKQERICLELWNKVGVASSLSNQALLLSEKKGKHEEALSLVEEAYSIAADHGLDSLAEQIKPILDQVRAKVVDL